ncbi:MAG: hypothetical protein M3068_00740 [Gemmatimonadota bacterium]|nr:hypothetical protein [Gemmatimonadota bacterium]MDQ6885796.1 hypothetical protein [Gemmatimonadota bacterium]
MLTPVRYDRETSEKFDRDAPIPRRTIHDLLATGVGQAASARLVGSMLLGFGAAAIILLLAPVRWWVGAAPPLCIGSFAAWGVATKRLHALDVAHASAPRKRLMFALSKMGATAVGVLAGLAGVIGALWLLLDPTAL